MSIFRVPDSVYKWECKVFSTKGPLLFRTRCSVSGVESLHSRDGVEFLEGPWNILIPPPPIPLDPRKINVWIGENLLEVESLTPVRTGVKLIATGVLTSPWCRTLIPLPQRLLVLLVLRVQP